MASNRNRAGRSDLLERSGDEARFFRGWLRRPLVMGAVVPSSRALGRAMAACLPVEAIAAGGMAVLELGPGTGVVTRCLLERGVAEESLVMAEYSPDFCALLRARFPAAAVVEGDAYGPSAAVERALAGRTLGAVVSSLPLFTRPEAQREAILAAALDRLPAGHPVVQFSYALTAPVKPARVGATLAVSPWIKLNLPPARVLVYRRG